MYGKKEKGHVSFQLLESKREKFDFIKVWRQKDICMGKSQMDMCPFSYWRAREANSESTGVVNFMKVRRQKKIVICRSARLALKKLLRTFPLNP